MPTRFCLFTILEEEKVSGTVFLTGEARSDCFIFQASPSLGVSFTAVP